MSLIEDIRRNSGLGTLGKFDAAEPGDYSDYGGKSIVLIGDDLRIAVVLGDHAEAQANAARFEAVPDMEAALLAAMVALNAADQHFKGTFSENGTDHRRIREWLDTYATGASDE